LEREQPNIASSYGWPKWHLLLVVGFYTFLKEDFIAVGFMMVLGGLVGGLVGVCMYESEMI